MTSVGRSSRAEDQGLPGAQCKDLPVQETGVQPLGREGRLEEGVSPLRVHAWRSPWAEEPGGLQSVGSQGQTRLSH